MEDDGELGWHVELIEWGRDETVEEVLNCLPGSAQNVQVVGVGSDVLITYLIPYADRAPEKGVWLAYYVDWSGFAVFETEIEALRYGNDNHINHMRVEFLPFGEDLRTLIDERR